MDFKELNEYFVFSLLILAIGLLVWLFRGNKTVDFWYFGISVYGVYTINNILINRR